MPDDSRADGKNAHTQAALPSDQTACGDSSTGSTAEHFRMADPREKLLLLPEGESLPEDSASRPKTGELGATAWLPRIAGFEILGELGRGGMGVVYLARQRRPARLVALKMILDGQGNRAALARFHGEEDAIASLQHPHIVQIYAVGEQEGVAYFAMEFCAGGTLARRLNDAPLAPAAAAGLVEALARALHAAHLAGVVHRDLKPANVLLAADGTPKISDFGLSKRLDDDSGQTHTGTVMGTPSYMAPEQASGKTGRVSPAADVHALGALLYECLVGRPPFRGASVLETLDQVRSQDPVSPRRLQPKTPRDLETICLKCLQKEPKKRYESAEALADDLSRFQQGKPILAHPVGPAERVGRWGRRQPVAAAASALALLCTVLLLVGAFRYTAQLGEAEGKLAAAHAKADAAQTVADAAQKVAASQEYVALLSGVRQRINQGRPGWTWDALADLGRAARLDVAGKRPVELRTEAAACLSGVDVRMSRPLAEGFCASRLAYQPDGRLLALGRAKAAAFASCSIRLVDPATGDLVREIAFPPSMTWQLSHGVQDGVRALAFSPDGRWLAAGMRSGMLHRWDLKRDPPEPISWEGHDSEVTCLCFSPTGNALVSSAADGVKRWPEAAPAETPAVGGKARQAQIVVSPNGDWVACADDAGIRLLDPKSLQALGQPFPLVGSRLAVSPDGRTLAVARAGTLQLIDASAGQALRTFRAPGEETAHESALTDLAFSPNGVLLASSSSVTGRFQLWDVADGRLLVDQLVGGDARLAFSPDGRGLAVLAGARTDLFQLGGLREETIVGLQPWPIRNAALSPDGRTLACQAKRSGEDAEVALWPLSEEGETSHSTALAASRWQTRLRDGDPAKLAFAPAGRRLAATQPNEATLFDLGSATAIQRLPLHRPEDLCFDAEGRLWTASETEVQAWSVPEGREVAHWSNALSGTLSGLGTVWAVSAGRTWALAGGRDGTLCLLRVSDAGRQSAWPLSGGPICTTALNEDESLAAVGTKKEIDSEGCLSVPFLWGGVVPRWRMGCGYSCWSNC